MSNIKKLNDPSIPRLTAIADDALVTITDKATGTVANATFATFAKLVGKALGVQLREWTAVAGGKWYRVANVSRRGLTSAILLINHQWSSGASRGVNLSFNAAPSGSREGLSLVQLSGSGLTFSKVRYVIEPGGGNTGNGFIDLFVTKDKIVPIHMAVFSNGGIDLVDTLAEAPSVEGLHVHEISPTTMGGVNY
ncbi:MAG: hypothetical protein K2M06_02625 [Muribaculaceae bacterium]|nr:hypothetical protein [Muribaculaceae bacterium]